jgi:hypothetical protein
MGEIRLDQRMRVAILAVLAVAVVVIAFLLISGDDDQGAVGPTIVSTDAIEEIAEDAEGPVYWAGERPGTLLVYERTEDGLIYVRYLPGDPEADDPSTSFLTVGTYRVGDAVKVLEELARTQTTVRTNLPGGGLVVIDTEQPTSAYVAHPGEEQQVEVYAPDPRTTVRVATSGEIVPIG